MAKKSFKNAASASIQVPKIAQTDKSKQPKEKKEKREVTTFLLKPSLKKRFKIVCVEKDLKVGDELESMFIKWLEENED